jgi:hypothetical protein
VRADKPTGFGSGSIQGFRLATGTDATTVGNAYTLANAIGLTIDAGSAGANAAISNNYGILINDQTKGTSDYGMVIQGADTYALWVQADTTRLDGAIVAGDSLTTSNQGVEFTESDTNPTCGDENYNIFADASEHKLKKCVDGVISDIDAGTKYETFTADGTYTKPTDAAMVILEMWGAGGGGGGGAGGSNVAARTGGGAGGGGVFVTESFLASNLGSTVEVDVGTGGTAGTAGSNAVGGDGGAGNSSCFSTSANCGGTMILRAYGGGFGNGDGAAGNGGGGGGGSISAGGNGSGVTFGAGGGPISGTAAASAVGSDGNGGGNGGTAGTGTVNGGGSHYGGGGGAPSTTAGGANGGAGGSTTRGGGGGGGSGSCAVTTCTARNGGAGGAVGGGIVAAGTAGTGAGGAGGNGGAGTTIYGGGGGGGGANSATTAGGTGGNGGIPGGAGGGGGGAHTGSTVGGAGGTGARGEVRIWSVRGSGADLAEIYATNESDLKAGDVVCLDSSLKAGVKKCTTPYDKTTFGVITTTPGLVIGDIEDVKAKAAAPVVLAGRTPIRVSTENGPIKAGDLLTPSSNPGVAMRATKAGQIVGQAMAPYNGEGVGTTMVFVKTNFSHGSVSGLVSETAGADFGRQMLGYLVGEDTPLSQPAEMSDIFTDRVVAGLEITAPKVTTDTLAANTIEAATAKDITLKLAEEGGLVVKNSSGEAVLSFGSAGASLALDLDVKGGLEIGGDATFQGKAVFKRLVTFIEKTVFRNDVSFEGHILTEGDPPAATIESAAGAASEARVEGNDTAGQLSLKLGPSPTSGKALQVKFKKPYTKNPKVFFTPANQPATDLKYYVESSPTDFSIVFSEPPPANTTFTFNYWVVQ